MVGSKTSNTPENDRFAASCMPLKLRDCEEVYKDLEESKVGIGLHGSELTRLCALWRAVMAHFKGVLT